MNTRRGTNIKTWLGRAGGTILGIAILWLVVVTLVGDIHSIWVARKIDRLTPSAKVFVVDANSPPTHMLATLWVPGHAGDRAIAYLAVVNDELHLRICDDRASLDHAPDRVVSVATAAAMIERRARMIRTLGDATSTVGLSRCY